MERWSELGVWGGSPPGWLLALPLSGFFLALPWKLAPSGEAGGRLKEGSGHAGLSGVQERLPRARPTTSSQTSGVWGAVN